MFFPPNELHALFFTKNVAFIPCLNIREIHVRLRVKPGLFSLLSRKRVLLSGGGGGGGGGGGRGKCLNYLFLHCPLGSRADAGQARRGW